MTSDDNQMFRTDHAYNLHLARFEASRSLELPILPAVDVTPAELIGWNYARGGEPEIDQGVHFFLDDYQFESVWSQPEKYTDRLSEWGCVCTPDFSLFRDMPYPMQLWNVYRSRALGAYWADNGITVVPTLQWSIPQFTIDFLDGMPYNSTVAVSSLGITRDPLARELWCLGMRTCIEEITPKRILYYGLPLDFDFGNIEVVTYRNKNAQRFDELHARSNRHGR